MTEGKIIQISSSAYSNPNGSFVQVFALTDKGYVYERRNNEWIPVN